MKNLLIILLLVTILALASFMHKSGDSKILQGILKKDIEPIEKGNSRLYLLYFYSRYNCEPCLEVIDVLNRLPKQYSVIGIVPENELREEDKLRSITKANFPLVGLNKYKKYIPPYAPTLFGVSRNNEIFFILPSVPNENNYLVQFLSEFTNKANPLLAEK